MTQYTVINDTDKTLYLNSMEIPLRQGEKRWFYFDAFDMDEVEKYSAKINTIGDKVETDLNKAVVTIKTMLKTLASGDKINFNPIH